MTKIEWTDETRNLARGCSRVSPGCDNCYAISMARRQDRRGGAYEGLTRIRKSGALDWSGFVRYVPDQAEAMFRWRKPRNIFLNSMSDTFHSKLSFHQIAEMIDRCATLKRHTFQILTKRAERMRDFGKRYGPMPPNVWLGVTAENQACADERIPLLLRTPATVRWVSAEPLLGPIDLTIYLGRGVIEAKPGDADYDALNWVVVGGESGSGARACSLACMRSIVGQCEEYGVPCFIKQLGARWYDVQEGRAIRGCAVGAADSAFKWLKPGGKWSDPNKWPHDLRVRQLPQVAA